MKTDDLISTLVRDVRPVEQSSPPLLLFAKWSAIGLLYLAAGVLMIGTRDDLAKMWNESEFVVHSLIVSCLTVLAASAAFALSIPGRQLRWARWSTSVALAAWLAWIVATLMTGSEPHAGLGWKCLRNIAVLGIPLGMLMYYLIKRAAPLQIGTVGWLAGLGAAAGADLATRFICRNDQALHALIWHFVPVLAMACAGFALGRVLLRWETRRFIAQKW